VYTHRVAPATLIPMLLAPLWAGLVTLPVLAQEQVSEDEEIRRLRQEAEDELLGLDDDLAPRMSEEERLRQMAESDTEDESPLYTQLLSAFSSVANRLNAFNPRITVFGDGLGRFSASSAELVEEIDGDDVNLDDRFSIREVELDFRADIDPYSKGVLILGLEEHAPGEYEIAVEEAYLTLETLPFGFRAKLGRYRMPFGSINQLHIHDLPQSTRPYALVDFFGEEGFADNGINVTWLAPWIPLELGVHLLNGENEGVLAGSNSDDPAWLGRATYFHQVTDQAYLSAGVSYLFGYNDAPTPVDRRGGPNQETHVAGADLLVKWQNSQFQSVVFQGELYHLRKDVGGGDREHGFGGFALLQVQPLQRWYVGARYDYSNYMEGMEDREQWAGGVWLSYYTTEFLRFRIGYEHRERSTTNGGEPDLDTIYFQVTFVFGSHPVEPYWFNR
jgi:hypothetical protein